MQIARRRALSWMGSTLIAGCHPFARAATLSAKTTFGVNFNRLFLGALDDHLYGEGGLASLGRQGVPFVRFAASGQWAGDWARFEADPDRYWQVMDRTFSAAESSGVKLVPCVLWHTVALAMHCGETMQAWVNPASRTGTMADRYTATFVERYDRSPALMMYEFSNELNTWVDFPAAALNKYWPKKDPTLPDRGPLAQDRLSSQQLHDIASNFAGNIRKHSSRPISMGSDTPRPNAWHMAHDQWDTDDHHENMDELNAVTPANMDVLSIHAYDSDYGQPKSAFQTFPELLEAFVQAAAASRRKTFIGEFGVARSANRSEEQKQFGAMIQAIQGAGVDYAALWNYSPVGFQAEWDVSEQGERAYQLEMIRQANRR